MKTTGRHRIFVALGAVYLLLSLLYQRATPPMEAADEGAHFAYVAHLHEEGTLPLPSSAFARWFRQEVTQPPPSTT